MTDFSRLFSAILVGLMFAFGSSQAQDAVQLGGELNLDYAAPRQFVIADVTVTGTKYLDKSAGFSVWACQGDTLMIPGEGY